MAGQTTRLRPQRPLPSAHVCLDSAVRASPPMARNLPAYRRGRAPQAGRDAANRSTRSNPARNLFAFIKHQRHRAAPATGAIPPLNAKTWWIAPLVLASARAISLAHWPPFQRSQSSAFFSRDNPGRPVFAMRVPPHLIIKKVLRRSVEPTTQRGQPSLSRADSPRERPPRRGATRAAELQRQQACDA